MLSEPHCQAHEIQIETTRLWLRMMRADDFDALLKVFTDPNVMTAFQAPPFTPGQMHHWLQRNLDHQSAHGFGLFSIILKEEEALIGDCGLELMQIDGVQVAELGYDLHSDYWNKGYATEAATAVRDFAFQALRLPLLISLVRQGNKAPRRVAEKVGMTYVAELQNGDRHYWKFELRNKSHE